MFDYITEVNQKQVAILAAELLIDERFPWRERKMKTFRLARLYELAGYKDYAIKAAGCSTWLQYGIQEDGAKKLQAVNFCQLRLCPMCMARRAKRAAYKLSKVLNMVEAEHDARFLFLTLTIRNCEGTELGNTIEHLIRAWDRFRDQRQIQRSVRGWFRALEVTRRDKGYHPHLHVILAVEPGYFTDPKLYLPQNELVRRWRKALRVDYDPSVRISVTRARGEKSAGKAAAVEAAKYAVKDEDYIDPKLTDEEATDILRDYTIALWGRRLTAFGGWMRDAAQQLEAENLDDGDLVHADEEAIREDVAQLIEEYRWSFGAGDYILSARMPGEKPQSPLRVERRA